jgi:transcription elongation factor GreB
MSKAFTKESDDDDEPEQPEIPDTHHKNYVTPSGYATLQNELRQLVSDERPKIVEVVRWAAGNGDRSENGDYIYGKRRLREIDRRVRYLIKRIEGAEVVDPERQKNLTQVFFGATVTYALEDGTQKTKTLLKASVGDTVQLHSPGGVEELQVIAIKY